MPESKFNALQQLQYTERNMELDPLFEERYCEKM